MTDHRYGDRPLGKSVEEVESEQGNRVNSPVPGEARRNQEDAAIAVPAVVSGGSGGSAGLPAVLNADALVEQGSGPTDAAATDTTTESQAGGDRSDQDSRRH